MDLHIIVTTVAPIKQLTYSNGFSSEQKNILYTYLDLNFSLRGPIGHELALAWVIAWRRTGDKSLHEPMLTKFYETIYIWIMLWNKLWFSRDILDS